MNPFLEKEKTKSREKKREKTLYIQGNKGSYKK